jgi:hypothetical protein
MDRKDADRVGIYKILRIIDRFQHVGCAVDSSCTNELEIVLFVDSDAASVMSTIISSQPRGSVNEWHRIHPPEAL